jgi:hypothetical protein
MNIIPSYDSSVNPSNFGGIAEENAFKNAIKYVIAYYDQLFANPITITIDIGYGEYGQQLNLGGAGQGKQLDQGALGESIWIYNGQPGSYNANANDNNIISDLVNNKVPGASTLPTTPLADSPGTLLLSPAQAMALGVPNIGSVVGAVGFSSNPNTFFYSTDGSVPPSAVQLNETYFVGVAEHEFSEVLGRVSLLNDPGFYSIMDLYRFSAPGQRDLTPVPNTDPNTGLPYLSYFSIDGGATPLHYWNSQYINQLESVQLGKTVKNDLGDWAGVDQYVPSVLSPPDAYLNESPPAQINSVTQVDLTLMSSLGWDVTAYWQVGNGDFNVGTDWSSLVPPTLGVDTRISAAGTYTVTSSADETTNSLVTGKGATLAINASTFTITNGTGTGANAGTIAVTDGATLQVGCTFKNTGTVQLNSVFVPTKLVLSSDVVLSGAGDVTLSDSDQNEIATAIGAQATFTNLANTISGAGLIGTGDGTLTLINNKIIDATGINNALVIDTGTAVVNTGTLESTAVAGLTLYDDINNTGGLIYAASTGSSVNLNGITVSGGKLNIVAGATAEATGGTDSLDGMTITDKGVLEATHDSTMTFSDTTVNATGGTVEASDAITLSAATILLSDATINGGTLTTSDGCVIETLAGTTDNVLSGVAISAGTTVTVTDDSSLTLAKTITNAGTLAVDSTGDATDLLISGTVSLQGGGSVTLSDNSNNEILSDGSTAKLTNVDNTISGAGLIGDGDPTLTLVNKGTIDADDTHPLILNTGANTISSPGELEVTNGSTLIVNGPIYLANVTPAATTNRLYSNAGSLYWAGSLIGGGSVGNWATDGTNVWRTGGNVGIGTTSPFAALSIAGSAYLTGAVTAAGINATNATTTNLYAAVATIPSLTVGSVAATSTATSTFTGPIQTSNIIAKGPWVDVRFFGAIGNGIHDDTSAIQAAIDYIDPTGGTVLLPPGKFLISSTLVIASSSVTIEGSGYSFDPLNSNDSPWAPTSELLWSVSATGAPFISIGGTNDPVSGDSFTDFSMDGNNTATDGIDADQMQFGSIQKIGIRNITGIGLYGYTDSSNATIDFRNNTIQSVSVDNAAQIIKLVGNAAVCSETSNAPHDSFTDVSGAFTGTSGIDIVQGDNNTFSNIMISRRSGTGYGIYLDAGANSNYFFHVEAGGGTYAATPCSASDSNEIYGYDKSNGEANPIVASGANLTYTEDSLNSTGWNIDSKIAVGSTTPALFPLDVFGDSSGTLGDSSGQFAITGFTNSNQRLSFGYQTDNNDGFIQALTVGSAFNSLNLNHVVATLASAPRRPVRRLRLRVLSRGARAL